MGPGLVYLSYNMPRTAGCILLFVYFGSVVDQTSHSVLFHRQPSPASDNHQSCPFGFGLPEVLQAKSSDWMAPVRPFETSVRQGQQHHQWVHEHRVSLLRYPRTLHFQSCFLVHRHLSYERRPRYFQ